MEDITRDSICMNVMKTMCKKNNFSYDDGLIIDYPLYLDIFSISIPRFRLKFL